MRSQRWNVTRMVLGIVLLTAAILKMSGGNEQVMRLALPFLSPRLYAAGVIAEAILGIWLLLGIAPQWSWLCSIGFFIFLGFLSLRLGLRGQASCGCVGSVALSPWLTLTIDATALLMLAMSRPVQIRAGLRRGLPVLTGAVSILAILFGLQLWAHGSLAAAFAHLRGEPIAVSPPAIDIGTGVIGTSLVMDLSVTNYLDRTIRIIGGTSDCSCMTTRDLPFEIPPQDERGLRVKVNFKGTPGLFHREFVLYADTGKLTEIPVAVIGRLVERP